MVTDEIRKDILEIAGEISIQEGVELVDVELAGPPGRYIVRIYIDREGGVSISDCATFSKSLAAILDIEDPLPGSYSLEVSSPGIERVLRSREHFSGHIGEDVKIKLIRLLTGRRNITGTLVAADDEHVEVKTGGELIRVPYDLIRRANLKPMPPSNRTQKGAK